MGHPSGRGDWLGSGHSSWRSFISSTKQFGRADLLTLEWFWKQRQSQSGRLASFCHFLPTPRATSISFHLVGHAVLQMQVSSNSNNFVIYNYKFLKRNRDRKVKNSTKTTTFVTKQLSYRHLYVGYLLSSLSDGSCLVT